jgi:hypothetical protein
VKIISFQKKFSSLFQYSERTIASTVEFRFKKESRFRKIVVTTDFLVHKLFDLRKIFSPKVEEIGTFWQF